MESAISAAIAKHDVEDVMVGVTADGARRFFRILVGTSPYQTLLDDLQIAFSGSLDWRIAVMPVEAAILSPEKAEKEEEQSEQALRRLTSEISREELLESLQRGTQHNWLFLVLVILSTVVASIGLLTDNVAVVIGAMVIAPLLGPNLALVFATAVGDRPLLFKAVRANAFGIGLALGLSVLVGLFWPYGTGAQALISRTTGNYGDIALALASGAAAVLSVSTGVSSALVGVMVAVALLPPIATCGIMLGAGRPSLALGALLLLAINMICINLSAQTVFALRGLGPRLWIEIRASRRRVGINIVVLLGLLALAAMAIGYFPKAM